MVSMIQISKVSYRSGPLQELDLTTLGPV